MSTERKGVNMIGGSLEDTGNLFPWHIWMDSSWHLSGWWGRMIKIQTNQEKTTRDKFFWAVLHKDASHLWDVLRLAWKCSYCIKLPKLNKLNSYRKQVKDRKRALQSSPSLHLQHVYFSLLMRNKWYSENRAKNPSLKLNISMYSQSLVIEGLIAPTSINHLSTRPVHIPPSCHHVLWQESLESLTWH